MSLIITLAAMSSLAMLCLLELFVKLNKKNDLDELTIPIIRRAALFVLVTWLFLAIYNA